MISVLYSKKLDGFMAEQKKDSKSKRPTAQKRDIQNAKKRLHNRVFKSRVKTAIRTFEKQVSEKETEAAKTQLNTVISLLDKGVKHNIFKLNKVGRLKAKYASRI